MRRARCSESPAVRSDLGWDGTGRVEVRFEIERLPLVEGRFQFNLTLTDHTGRRRYHSMEKAAEFTVLPQGERAASSCSRATGRSPRASALVAERQRVRDLREPRRVRVPLGRRQLAVRPLDAHLRIVVPEPGLRLGVVVGRDLVRQVGDVAQDAEAVGEPVRDIELEVPLGVQLDRLPLAERRRPRRMSTTTSRTEPRAQRTSFDWPGWKCMPRTIPRLESEWLSWTNSSVMPSSAYVSRR